MSKSLPILPMRNAVLFPGASVPIVVGRAGSLRAIEAALRNPEHLVFAVAQRDEGEEVNADKLYTMGTVARVGAVQRGGGQVRLVLEGVERGVMVRVTPSDGHLVASLAPAVERAPLDARDPAFIALHRELRERAAELAEERGLPEEVIKTLLAQVTEPGTLADFVAGYLEIPPAERQALLETLEVEDRLRRVLIHVQRQIQ